MLAFFQNSSDISCGHPLETCCFIANSDIRIRRCCSSSLLQALVAVVALHSGECEITSSVKLSDLEAWRPLESGSLDFLLGVKLVGENPCVRFITHLCMCACT